MSSEVIIPFSFILMFPVGCLGHIIKESEEGKHNVFSCPCKSKESSRVNWYRLEEWNERSIHVTIQTFNSSSTSFIMQPELKDEGLYQCELFNKEGKSMCNSTIELKVYGMISLVYLC